MVKDGQRFCDVCDEKIPKAAKYQRNCMPAAAAEIFRSVRAPRLVPTWTPNADGTISMDICITCVLSMKVAPGKNEVN